MLPPKEPFRKNPGIETNRNGLVAHLKPLGRGFLGWWWWWWWQPWRSRPHFVHVLDSSRSPVATSHVGCRVVIGGDWWEVEQDEIQIFRNIIAEYACDIHALPCHSSCTICHSVGRP